MELWVPITIAAAFLQNIRSAVQKHLRGRLTTLAAAYVRFLYALPFALAYLIGLWALGGKALPSANPLFFLYCLLGGLSQIVFTGLLVWLFSFRNFAVGTTYSKTELVQVAVLGFLILGDRLTLVPALAIVVAVAGVMVLSVGQARISLGALASGLRDKATLIGLLCGAFLGASVVFFRGASLSLEHPDVWMAAGFTLAVSLVLQTLIMGLFLAWREPASLKAVIIEWRWSLVVGLSGVLGSIAWFTAFTIQNAAYVRAVGQIELLFTFIASVFFFRERSNRVEVLGILLVLVGILMLILGR